VTHLSLAAALLGNFDRRNINFVNPAEGPDRPLATPDYFNLCFQPYGSFHVIPLKCEYLVLKSPDTAGILSMCWRGCVCIDCSYSKHGCNADVLYEWHDRIPQNDAGVLRQLRPGARHYGHVLDGSLSDGHSLEPVGHRLGQGGVQQRVRPVDQRVLRVYSLHAEDRPATNTAGLRVLLSSS